jgi:ubiquinone/menaquinone biosynthesis C-methylase UbiE
MQSFLNPPDILKKLKLRKGMVVADFGSGSGGWAIPLAKMLEEGKVYAIDILDEPLSALRAKIKIEKLFNIETRKADVEKGVTLLSNSCDAILMTNLLFECEKKKEVLEEGKRVLRKGGKILFVDWIKDNPLTPEIEWVDFEEIKEMAEGLGLKLEKEFEAGPYHKGLLLAKE